MNRFHCGRRFGALTVLATAFTVGPLLSLAPFECHAKDDKPAAKGGNSSPAAKGKQEQKIKQKPLKLLPSDQVLEALKKTAESEPTIISGNIDKGMKLQGLVVIKPDAVMASEDVELVPTSGAIVVNHAPAVFYKPEKIKGVPFISIATSPKPEQKSHMYASPRLRGGGGYENCVFKGRLTIDTACGPKFSNCLFLGAPKPNCLPISKVNNAPEKSKFYNCLFYGFNFGNNYILLEFIGCCDSCGFKEIFDNPVKPLSDKELPANCRLSTEDVYALYDFDGNVLPVVRQLKYKFNPILNFSALPTEKNTIPYFDKLDEIRELLDKVAAAHGGADK